jgi:hypothetical protein
MAMDVRKTGNDFGSPAWLSTRIQRAMAGSMVVVAMLAIAGPALAGEADVLAAKATKAGDGWRFDVTIRSNDKGWDYYCDRFEILAPDGAVLGTRILVHPHDDEQPFTRSLGNVRLPVGLQEVRIRAAMKPNGASGDILVYRLPH